VTIEKTCFVYPADIKAVRIVCSGCNTTTSIRMNDLSHIASLVERNCVMCGQPTGFPKNTKESNELIVFNETLGRLAELMKGRHIAFSIQIECPE
jgi:hypothetical protein